MFRWQETNSQQTRFICLTDMVSTVREILRRGMSVNLYMFHGGSSFGFMGGALNEHTYKALVTSYGWFLCCLCTNMSNNKKNNNNLTPCRQSQMTVIIYAALCLQITMHPCLKLGSTHKSIIFSEIYFLDSKVSEVQSSKRNKRQNDQTCCLTCDLFYTRR